jgi:hypothetical protein
VHEVIELDELLEEVRGLLDVVDTLGHGDSPVSWILQPGRLARIALQ